jgi:RimJ/RimL family protein N-acetyltransferase
MESFPPPPPIIRGPRLDLILVSVDQILSRADDHDGPPVPLPYPDPDDVLHPERSALQHRIGQVRADPAVNPWLIRLAVLRDRGVIVGNAGFHDRPDHDGMVELGYTVLPRHRGHGYGREIASTLWAWADDHPQVRVLRASVRPDNVASLRIIESAGLRRIGEQWDDVDGLEWVFERSAARATASPGSGPVVLLRTPRLQMREFTDADVDRLVDLDSDPEVMRYITGGAATSRETIATDHLPAWRHYYRNSPGLGFWAAESSGQFVGWFHLRPGAGHGPDEPEVGYRLRRECWGRGLATEGTRALIDHAFRNLGARRVLAETMVVNAASRRVMEKSGMRLRRRFHADWEHAIPGDELGDVEYCIERDEWSG